MVTDPRDDAFDRLFLAHFSEVYRLLFRFFGSRPQAEDLAQETFVRLYQRSDGLEEEHARAWLFRVATNLAHNARRGEIRRADRHERAARLDGTGQTAGDPATLVVRRLEVDAVRHVLGHLPRRQAQILMLRHAGLSYREIAEAVEVAPSSVGTLLARAERAFEVAYQIAAAVPEAEPAATQEESDGL